MATSSDTNLPSPIFNVMPLTVFNGLTDISSTEFYFVDPEFAGGKVLITDSNGNLVESTITSTQLSSLGSVTSDIQTQINNKMGAYITGTTDPTASTVGEVGSLYLNTSSGDIFECTEVSGSTYTWKQVLKNNGTGAGALAILGTATGSNSVALGSGSRAVGVQSCDFGYKSTEVGASGNYATSFGSESHARGNYSVAIGRTSLADDYGVGIGYVAKASASYAIQLGSGTNSAANTFSVGLSASNNYRLLNSDGTVPAERLAKIMISGAADPTTSTVGTLGLIYKNTSSGKLFYCTAVDTVTPSYTWDEIGSGTSTAPFSNTYTLSAASWNNKSYTLSISAVTNDSVIFISPAYSANGSNETAYANANVRGASQSAGTLVIACDTTPTADINVSVVVIG